MSCIFCGSQGDTEPVKLPKTFTAIQFLQAGSGACVHCAQKLRDPKYRRNCWLIKNGVFSVLNNPLRTLLNPPEPPFFVYLTRSKRKHGWIVAVQNPVLNSKKFFITVDEDKILIDTDELRAMLPFAQKLRNRGVPKKTLLNGCPSPSVIRKYGLSHAECSKLKKLQHNQQWRICVEFGP